MWHQEEITLAARPRGLHLVTRDVVEALGEPLRAIRVGMAHLFLRHTSASLTLNENASPDVRRNLAAWLDRAVPDGAPYFEHTLEGDDDMAAHVKATLTGASLTLPVSGGRLALGTWQGITLCEHRDRGRPALARRDALGRVTVYGALVERDGLAASHRLVLDAVPAGARVLDVGCAEGYLAAALTARGCAVVGVEADPTAAAVARGRGLAVREIDLDREPLDTGGFDCVVFADVLEHLRAPEAVLRAALSAGRAVVSLPNIAHWTGRRALLRGRFPRDDHGLFDRTHLRFFTRATTHALAREAGWRVERETFAEAPLPFESRVGALRRARPLALRRAPELFALQVVLSLVPAAS